jgi:hypothetical protein
MISCVLSSALAGKEGKSESTEAEPTSASPVLQEALCLAAGPLNDFPLFQEDLMPKIAVLMTQPAAGALHVPGHANGW